MSGAPGSYASDVSNVARFEKQLATALGRSVDELDHAECFDFEQRSELYTILHTLKSETDAHCAMVGRWVSDKPQG